MSSSTESRKPAHDRPTDGLSRRGLLQTLGGVAGAGMLGSLPSVVTPRRAEARTVTTAKATAREAEALQRRTDAAIFQLETPLPTLATNDDETLYANRIGSFTKTLPHNDLGEVDPAAYDAYLTALASGAAADFDAIPGGGRRLANPRAAFAFGLGGADSHKVDMPAVHAFSSARQSAELGEVYWMALTRDVRFSEWDTHARILAAADDMSTFSDFTGPKEGGQVTPNTLFRGLTPGDLVGPYISQFLYLDVPYGNQVIEQRARHPVLRDDYMTTYDSWLAVQRGQLPSSENNLRQVRRYITRGRDLGEYVHHDHPYQAYLNAALICLGFGVDAFDDNPYTVALREGGFVTFGAAGLLDLVASAAVASLRAAWFHKWLVHRKLRPEAYGGRIHNHVTGAASYPIDSEILGSPVLDRVFSEHGTYLLPQAFPEGSPTHPSYPAGHATIAGACVTVIKAFCEENFEIPSPVIPNTVGSQLQSYSGDPLTLGGELNKLASNVALGRNFAGVHWRADGDDGLVAGETVAITLLQDYLRTVVEDDAALRLTRFDGTTILVTQDSADPV